MKRAAFILCLFALLFVMRIAHDLAYSQDTSSSPGSSSQKAGQIDRGRYIVEEIAKCSECHTPRTETGVLDRTRWLQGASIWIEPIPHFSNWADRAPTLAGLPGYSDEQMKRVLEDGVGANGQPLQPPMHEYHMNAGDSQAVTVYLRSIPVTNP